jgi:perosamine synthetase
MSSLQAALGLAQLERIEELIGRKREAFGWYKEELAGLDGVRLNAEPAGTRNAYWMVTVVLSATRNLRKRELMDRLAERGIDARPFFHPLSSLPAYAHLESAARGRERNSVSYGISDFAVNLPSSLSLTREDVGRVAAALRDILAG